MRIEWRQLGEKLVRAGATCKTEMVLVAPFMKSATLSRIIDCLPPSASLMCMTRWRLEEIAAGVSDLECWDIVSRRPNSRFLLRSNLHAKYFRFDGLVYLGSANLTMTALGWSKRPNAEALLAFFVEEIDSSKAFEESLLDGVVDVTADLVTEFKTMLESYSVPAPIGPLVPERDIFDAASRDLAAPKLWLPRSRSPEYLHRVYSGENDAMTTLGLVAANEDLLDLELPPGLSEVAFRNVVASRLAATPVMAKLDQFLISKRRFGEMRSWLAAQLGVRDATDEWQRLMRWLLFFLPNKYEAKTANYSEIFGRKA
jgi:hypothetical protein